MDQRIAGCLVGIVAGVICLVALVLQMYVTFIYLAETADAKRVQIVARGADYQWMALICRNRDGAFLRRSAAVPLHGRRELSADDAALVVRRGSSSRGQCLHEFGDLLPRARLGYVYFSQQDLSREAGDEERRAVEEILKRTGLLSRSTPVLPEPCIRLYRSALRRAPERLPCPVAVISKYGRYVPAFVSGA